MTQPLLFAPEVLPIHACAHLTREAHPPEGKNETKRGDPDIHCCDDCWRETLAMLRRQQDLARRCEGSKSTPDPIDRSVRMAQMRRGW